MIVGNYDGGKGKVFRQIINEMPPHGTYVEPFVGGGSVALHKKPARRNILIDLDPDVIHAWHTHLVKNGGAAATSDVTMGAAIAAPDDAAPSLPMTMPSRIVTFDDGIWYELYVADALQLLPLLGLDSDTLIYADPPYLFDVRFQKDYLYQYEMGEDSDHRALIRGLDKLPGKIMISGYWSGLYKSLLGDWRTFEYVGYDRGGNKRQEFVWCNFPEVARLHDYQWLGDNFRERERIRRKATRWVNRFKSLPTLERRRILAELEAAGVLV